MSVARALGADGHPVESPPERDGLDERPRTPDGPPLLDWRTSREVWAVWLEEAFERGTA